MVFWLFNNPLWKSTGIMTQRLLFIPTAIIKGSWNYKLELFQVVAELWEFHSYFLWCPVASYKTQVCRKFKMGKETFKWPQNHSIDCIKYMHNTRPDSSSWPQPLWLEFFLVACISTALNQSTEINGKSQSNHIKIMGEIIKLNMESIQSVCSKKQQQPFLLLDDLS